MKPLTTRQRRFIQQQTGGARSLKNVACNWFGIFCERKAQSEPSTRSSGAELPAMPPATPPMSSSHKSSESDISTESVEDCATYDNKYRTKQKLTFSINDAGYTQEILILHPTIEFPNENLLIKVQHLDSQYAIDVYNKEVEIYSAASKIRPKVCPEIKDHWICGIAKERYGYIVQEDFFGAFRDNSAIDKAYWGDFKAIRKMFETDTVPENLLEFDFFVVLKNLFDKLDSLHDNNILHNDIREQNILYKVNINLTEPVLETCIIDFGLSLWVDTYKPVRARGLMKLFDDLDLIDVFTDFKLPGIRTESFTSSETGKRYDVTSVKNKYVLDRLYDKFEQEYQNCPDLGLSVDDVKKYIINVYIYNRLDKRFVVPELPKVTKVSRSLETRHGSRSATPPEHGTAEWKKNWEL